VHAEGGLTCRASNSAWTKRITDAIARLDHEIGRFTAAIGTGGDLASLVEALRAREPQRAELRGQLARLAPTRNLTRDASAWRRAARARLKDWRDSMQRNTQEARQVLSTLLDGPIRFTPLAEREGWRFEGRGTIEPLFSGLALSVASPGGRDTSCFIRTHACRTREGGGVNKWYSRDRVVSLRA
jgi:hypothetical protein